MDDLLYYSIYKQDPKIKSWELVASGLSEGELKEYLLDCYRSSLFGLLPSDKGGNDQSLESISTNLDERSSLNGAFFDFEEYCIYVTLE